MSAFRPGQSARAAHSALKSAVQTMENAQQNAVLWFGEILRRRLYRDLGYSSINQYAQQELGWSRTRTTDFIQVSQKLEKLPRVKKQVASGQLGYTKARELVKVAVPKNEEQWLKLAQTRSRRELEVEIKQARRTRADQVKGQASLLARPKAQTVAISTRISLEMAPEQLARYEMLWEQIRKRGAVPADRVEALLSVMAGFLEQDPELPPRGGTAPAQIHVHQCPDCQKTTVQTRGGELELSEATAERLSCDVQISQSGKRNTSTIPPRTRREVLARDRHRCRRKGCRHSRFLEIHHIEPRGRGGGNEPDNLVTLCAACHRLWHEKGGMSLDLSETAKKSAGKERSSLPP